MRSSKNWQVVLALLQHRAEDVAEEVLGQVGVGVEVGEGDLRLDHPELGQVARGVGVLGAEGGAEGVHVAHGEAVRLHVELPGHGEAGRAPKKSAAKSTSPPAVRGRFTRSRVETRNISPAPSASEVVMIGGVDPEEAPLVEEAVHGHGEGVPHPRDRAEGVGARAEVRHLAQELEGVLLGLDGVRLGVVHPPQHLQGGGLDLHRLWPPGGGDQLAGDRHGAPGGEALHLAGVVGEVAPGHHLDGVEARPVVDVDEGDPGLGVAAGAHPPLDGDFLPGLDPALEQVCDHGA